MASKAYVHDLMAQIGPQLDLLGVTEFEEDNLWVLAFDEDFVVEADYLEDEDRLYLAISLGSPPQGQEVEFYKMLLRFNYLWEETGGARMALDDDEGEVVMIVDLAASIELPAFHACLEKLREIVPPWRTVVQQYAAEKGAPAPIPDEAAFASLRV